MIKTGHYQWCQWSADLDTMELYPQYPNAKFNNLHSHVCWVLQLEPTQHLGNDLGNINNTILKCKVPVQSVWNMRLIPDPNWNHELL